MYTKNTAETIFKDLLRLFEKFCRTFAQKVFIKLSQIIGRSLSIMHDMKGDFERLLFSFMAQNNLETRLQPRASLLMSSIFPASFPAFWRRILGRTQATTDPLSQRDGSGDVVTMYGLTTDLSAKILCRR
jgi:hypothetical protein